MTKPFTTPFAADAPDNLFIPETAQPDGSVSYETGFGPDYSADPLEANAKPVPRAGHNELFNQITGSIGDIQRQGAADWYLEFAADGGYPKNAIVWLDGDRWKSQIDGNTTRPNIDEIAWLPSAKFEGGGGGGGGDFGLTGPTTIAVGGSFQYKISPYSSFMTYAVSATNGTATISGDTITLTIAPGETANVTDLTVVRSDGARNDFRIAIGAQSIAKPSILSPASGSVDVPLGPLLTASAFMTYPDGADTHLNTDWRIRTMAGAVVWQSLANPTNKTNIQVPDNTLPLNTQLQADVRYRGATLPVSAWSDAVTFTTTNQSISTPTITAPLNGATGIGATPTFTSTAFATNPLGADTHASSDWRLKNNLGTVIWSSIADAAHKTSITLPSGILAVSSQYTIEVRYNGGILQPSQWSPVVSFTTAATFAYDKYLAVGHSDNPNITMYGQDVDTFIELTFPSFGGTNNPVESVAFSPDGVYLALGLNSSPFIGIYKRSGDTFVKLANPAIPPTALVGCVSFSPDGLTLVCGTSGGTPTMVVYSRSGDVFTKYNDAADMPVGLVRGCAWHPGGVMFATANSSAPYVTVYRILSGVVTRLSAPGITPLAGRRGIAFSVDGVYMAAVGSASGGNGAISMYKISGIKFTKLSDNLGDGSIAQGVAFSPDGVYMAVGTDASSAAIFLYKRSGDTFTRLFAGIPSFGNTRAVGFSADGKLAAATLAPPHINIMTRSGDVFTKLANPASLPDGQGYSLSFYPPLLGR